MCHTYLVINLPKKGHECEHAIQVTGFSIQSHMCSFLQRCDQSGLTLVMLQHYFWREHWLPAVLTEVTMDGRPHSVLRSLLLCRHPCLSMLLSKTSTPNTLGFMGLGYFCIAALVTVSQGWLLKEKRKQHWERCYNMTATIESMCIHTTSMQLSFKN